MRFDEKYAEDRTVILRSQSETAEEIRVLSQYIERRDKADEYVDNETRQKLIYLKLRQDSLGHCLAAQNELEQSSADCSAQITRSQEAIAKSINDVATRPIRAAGIP